MGQTFIVKLLEQILFYDEPLEREVVSFPFQPQGAAPRGPASVSLWSPPPPRSSQGPLHAGGAAERLSAEMMSIPCVAGNQSSSLKCSHMKTEQIEM